MSAKSMHENVCSYHHEGGFQDKMLELNGERIFYTIQPRKGKDKTVVFIHGAFVNSKTMRPLAEGFNHHQAVLVDLPCHGNSTGALRKNMEQYAEIIRKFIHELSRRGEIHNQIILAGWSMGGSIALDLALSGLPHLKEVVLLNSAPMWQFPQIPREAFNLREIFNSAFTEGTPAEAKERILSHMAEYTSPLDTCMRDIEILNTFDIREKLRKVSVPTLIVSGEADMVASLEMQHVLHEGIAHSHMKIFEGRGHLFLLESPGDVADTIEAFIHGCKNDERRIEAHC